MFGWVLFGPDSTISNSCPKLNFISSNPAPAELGGNATVRELCRVDFSGINADPLLSESSRYDGPLANVDRILPCRTDDIKAHCIKSSAASPRSVYDVLGRYSCFQRLKRGIAWLLRFKAFVAWKHSSRQRPNTGLLTVSELDQAESAICKLVQSDSFSLEIDYFRSRHDSGPGSGIKRRKTQSKNLNRLLRLNTYFSDRLLRVGSRLRHADLPISQKNPIILPSQHHVTKLIVNAYHKANGHCGVLHVLSELRKRFWIIRGQSTVRSILRSCFVCKMRNAAAGTRWMAHLPSSRERYDVRPFNYDVRPN